MTEPLEKRYYTPVDFTQGTDLPAVSLENRVHSALEPEDLLLVQSGVLQSLLSAASTQFPIDDWEQLLNEL
jgi:hypothetical protein